MEESSLRHFHRTMGISLVVFIFLQAGTGFLISLKGLSVPPSHAHEDQTKEEVFSQANAAHDKGGMPYHSHENDESQWYEALGYIHRGAGTIGTIYRLLAGLGMLVMAISGTLIYFKIRARTS